MASKAQKKLADLIHAAAKEYVDMEATRNETQKKWYAILKRADKAGLSVEWIYKGGHPVRVNILAREKL